MKPAPVAFAVIAGAALGGPAAFTGTASAMSTPARSIRAVGVQPAPAVNVPLDTTVTSGGDSYVDVAMGRPRVATDVFWELFRLPAGSERWSLVTPPGVADNGGLVAATSSDGTASAPSRARERLLVGFETSQQLRFSPLASTVDAGTSWSPGLLPYTLARIPDALAQSDGGQPGATTIALVSRGSSTTRSVVETSGTVSTSSSGSGIAPGWKLLTSTKALASSRTTAVCGVRAITGVALVGNGTPLLGVSCSAAGAVGVLEHVDGTWRDIGTSLPRVFDGSGVTVLRLRVVGDTVVALVAGEVAVPATRGHTTGSEEHVAIAEASATVGLTSTSGGASIATGYTSTWSVSQPYVLPLGASLISTGVGEGPRTSAVGKAFLFITEAGRSKAVVLNGARGQWAALPRLPGGAVVLAFPSSGAPDAITVAGSTMTDYVLSRSSGPSAWSLVQRIYAPIQYGSSG